MYGQGKSWDTCQPAGFLSKKFTSTQHNYCMHKHETLAVLEALMKWEDKLLGRKFMVALTNITSTPCANYNNSNRKGHRIVNIERSCETSWDSRIHSD